MQFYFGIVILSSIVIFESLSLIHLSHRTTLCCIIFLFYVRCQDMCLHGYGIATVHRQCKVLFVHPLINLSSKKTTQNRYSINVTFLDYSIIELKVL